MAETGRLEDQDASGSWQLLFTRTLGEAPGLGEIAGPMPIRGAKVDLLVAEGRPKGVVRV
jgi:hypothetical protein